MSITQYGWQPTTVKDVELAVKKCQNLLNLRNWNVDIDCNDDPPPWAKKLRNSDKRGRADIDKMFMRASIWVPLGRHKADNDSAVQTAVHEMLHIAWADCDGKEEDYILRVEAMSVGSCYKAMGKQLPKEV